MRDAALMYIKRFGYLRNVDIEQLLYSDRPSGKRLAQLLTKSLVESGDIVENRLKGRASHYALKSDAALLQKISGHRDAANAIAIHYINQGCAVVTEREIQRSANREFHSKIPDALIIDSWTDELGGVVGEQRADYTWVEIENAERSGRDVITFGDWIVKTFAELPGPNWHVLPSYREGYISRVLVVVAAPAALKIQDRLLSYIERSYPEKLPWITAILPERLQFVSLL